MSQSSFVRRSLPPLKKNWNAQASRPPIANARITKTFTMSNWS